MKKDTGTHAYKPLLDVSTILEMSVALSMALLLAFFLRKIFLAPASVPLYYITYRKGPFLGMITCIVFSLITLPLALAYLPHPIVFIESPLEYLTVALAGFFPMCKDKNLSFKELFRLMADNGMIQGFLIIKDDFIKWLYDTRGIVISCILRYIVVIFGSTVYIATYWQFKSVPAILASVIMEWKAAFPGLIFFMVVVPILVKHRMSFRETRRQGEHKYLGDSNDTINTKIN